MSAIALEKKDTRHPAHELALKCLLAGLSNAVGSCITNPADLTKVRQQLYINASGEKFSPSFMATLVRMVQTEGPLSIFKGLSASMCREMSYSSLRMGTYDIFKTTIHAAAPQANPDSIPVKLAAGLGSGCLGAAVANPADLLKVRMQSAGNTLRLRDHFLQVWRTQGITGFWRGVYPTVVRAGILTSSQMGSYDTSKTYLKKQYPTYFPESFRTHVACSGIAGVVCSLTSAPVDVIKVRLMNDSAKQYKSAIHAVGLLLKNEGPFALYKGLGACITRLWPQTVISLLIFEELRALTGLKPI